MTFQCVRFIVSTGMILLLTIMLQAAEVTWTGAGGNKDWHNPDNWSTGSVPGKNDNVTVPQNAEIETSASNPYIEVNSLNNSGFITIARDQEDYIANDNTLVIHGDLQNQGILTMGLAGRVNILCKGNIENSNHLGILGTDLSSGQLKLSCASLWNKEGANLLGNHTLYLRVRGDLNNDGNIGAGNSIPTDVIIYCNRLLNNGDIWGGEGTDNSGFYTVKGDVSIHSRHGIYNAGSIQPGGTPSGPDTNGEGKKLSVKSMGANYPGTLYSRWAERPAKVMTEGRDSPFTLSGDSVILDTKILTFDTTLICGKHVLVDLDEQWEIWSAEGLSIFAAEGGVIDFSRTHTAEAIGAGEPVRIYADSIVPPVEGLNHIFNEAPLLFPLDSLFSHALTYPAIGSGEAGESLSLAVAFQNQSPVPKNIRYLAESVAGWLPEQTGTLELACFEADSVMLDFNIPAEAMLGATDTLTIVTSIDTSFTDTTYSYLFCIDEQPVNRVASSGRELPKHFNMQVWPNPFNPETFISLRVNKEVQASLNIYNTRGQLVRKLFGNRTLPPGAYQLSWNGRDEKGIALPSGLYVLQMVGANDKYCQKIQLIR